MTATPNTAALQALLDRVEAGTIDGMTPHCDLPAMHVLGAYVGSLDAAKALHEAVMPGWQWGRLFTGTMWVEPPDNADGRYRGFRTDNPARAWLIAIIRAIIAAPVADNEGCV